VTILNVGEKDAEGRQKRIEHRGRYLRASRTGYVSLRAQTKVTGLNVTANTNHGVRVSTRLAENTQVAFQNGRFVLRGRYGPDAAKVNLSKSGVTVSTKTPVGAINWLKPGRSSFKLGGIQVRGQKAVYLQAVYGVVALIGVLLRAVIAAVAGIVSFATSGLRQLASKHEIAAAENERPRFDIADVADTGDRFMRDRGVDLAREPGRDLLAALTFTMVALGRGEAEFGAGSLGLSRAADAKVHALLTDAEVAGRKVAGWVPDTAAEDYFETVLGLAHALASAFGERLSNELRRETLLGLDDACLAAGPRTLLQEEMLDVVAYGLGVGLETESEP
jgi:hypothetical protein